MANDIVLANPNNPIKNGSTVVSCGKTVRLTYNKYVQNNPTITNIQSKYDNRFIKTLVVLVP
jgi:hypothetical protein